MIHFFKELEHNKNIEETDLMNLDSAMYEKLAKLQNDYLYIFHNLYDKLTKTHGESYEEDTLKWIDDILHEPFFKIEEYIDSFYSENPLSFD
jgi:hypothetical protein